MQCDICKRPPSSKLPFICTFCAQDSLYSLRLQHSQVLLQKESREKQIAEAVSGKSRSSKSSSANSKKREGNPKWILQSAEAQQAVAEEKTESILSHTQSLREEAQKMKEDIAVRRSRLQQKRSALDTAVKALSQAKSTVIEPLSKDIRRISGRWDQLHAKTAESRIFLCTEAAHLYGLQCSKRKKNAKTKEIYSIGGTTIVDLRDLNSRSVS